MICTRIRVLKVYEKCNQTTAIRFIDEVVRRLPFRVQVVQTDNGAKFQSRFHWHLESLDIRHVYIRPRTPRLNGKVERSHRVDDQEFYQLLDKNGIADDSTCSTRSYASGRSTTTVFHTAPPGYVPENTSAGC
jgi:transposase InsO family protein